MAQPRLSSQAPRHARSFGGNSTQSSGPATDLPALTPSLLLATKRQVLSGRGSTLELPQALYADHPRAEVLSAATTASPSVLSRSWEAGVLGTHAGLGAPEPGQKQGRGKSWDRLASGAPRS